MTLVADMSTKLSQNSFKCKFTEVKFTSMNYKKLLFFANLLSEIKLKTSSTFFHFK